VTCVQIAVAPCSASTEADSEREFSSLGYKTLFSYPARGIKMPRKLAVNWDRTRSIDFNKALKKYKRYLEDQGLRNSTIEEYIGNAGRYLRFAKTDRPSMDDYESFRESLHEWKLSRSTINQYNYAIRAYHKMLGENISVTRLEPNNKIPYFFTADEVSTVFSVIHNLKHLAMLKTLFYACLRASELCALNDEDLDLKSQTIHIRNGKGGKEAVTPISSDCSEILKEYLAVRPVLEIDGKNPLFYTDYGNRWQRTDLYKMFIDYKAKAGITKPGGLHVFGRHSAASILIKNGCDIMTIKEFLRHEDIETTTRYLHISDQTKREKYERYLTV
jgi:integrase/recombinase XerD